MVRFKIGILTVCTLHCILFFQNTRNDCIVGTKEGILRVQDTGGDFVAGNDDAVVDEVEN